MAIKIGISCATPRDGIIGTYCVSAEIRNCIEDGTPALLNMFDFCMQNNIYAIVNIDLWTSSGHATYTELEWRQRVDGLVFELLKKEPTATKWRITIDNEPMKYMSKETYAWLINIAYDQIKIKRGWKHVMIGAGNEEFSLAQARGDMYKFILDNCKFDYIDIHIQAAVIDPSTRRVSESSLNYWGNTAKNWAVTYKKKLSCTEANWCDVATMSGYQDLIKMLNKAEEIGCEDFCVVFLDYRGNDYDWLCFKVRGVTRSPFWTDYFEEEIKNRKPKEVDMTEYLRPEELQALYDQFGILTPYNWETPNLFTAGKKDPAKTVTWADIDAMTETQLKALISALKKVGSLPGNFPDYPNIKYKADGTWNNNWVNIAKSNPK
jgi:hypothetical protein